MLQTGGMSRDGVTSILERMSRTLVHRGPDDAGMWVDQTGAIGLAFRRLAIQDLTAAGHQPMVSRTGRFTIVFNGEIYNHVCLRSDLARRGHVFNGHSDTETLCSAFEEWGVAGAVAKCIGMFAIVVWDQVTQQLHVIRDRLGIKPLYLYRANGLVLVASELKAFRAHPSFNGTLSRPAVRLFLQFLYVPAPLSIYEGVVKVQPGHIVTIDVSGQICSDTAFWSLEAAYAAGQSNPFTGSVADAIDELDTLLRDAVRIRMVADVPVGALLSGGIDSTAVVAMMAQAGAPVHTFSIGFDSNVHDESAFALAVAEHFSTRHTAFVADGAAALELVPELPFVFDEPLADPSQIPTLMVCRIARKEVTVALTGDGGDEVFAGYNRYSAGAALIESAAAIPLSLRRIAAVICGSRAGRAAAPLLEKSGQRLANEKLAKVARVLSANSIEEMYVALLTSDFAGNDVTTVDHRSAPSRPVLDVSDRPLLDRMLLADQSNYLPDDLLAKVDRASMAVSLEARVPLLDHRIVEFSWRLPADVKLRQRKGKWILREVLKRYVPTSILDRPKVGFTPPIGEWLRGPLKEWGSDLVSDVREPLNSHGAARLWRQFVRGDDRLALAAWTLVTLQAWRSAWKS